MTLRNLILSALMVGIISGLSYGLFQQLQINPIIYAAEAFEVAEPAIDHHAADISNHHHHDTESWAPTDGIERIIYTQAANVTVAFALALILISLMALHNQKSSKPELNITKGALWGLAALYSFFIAPALLGLHPEVPGTIAAELELRQTWWLFCTFASAAGIAISYYAPNRYKVAGLLMIAAPHIIGAPMPIEHGFVNTDPIAIDSLSALSQQFYTLTAIGMAILFIMMGTLCAFFLTKFHRA